MDEICGIGCWSQMDLVDLYGRVDRPTPRGRRASRRLVDVQLMVGFGCAEHAFTATEPGTGTARVSRQDGHSRTELLTGRRVVFSCHREAPLRCPARRCQSLILLSRRAFGDAGSLCTFSSNLPRPSCGRGRGSFRITRN